MPQMYTHSPNEHTRLAVWHIMEPESFFSGVVMAGKYITHPHKRLQHLCGRYLLQYLVPGFPMADVVAEQYNKPFLPGHPYHFSISHCDDYAAAIISTKQQVGVDIESVERRVLKIRQKFLTDAEEAILVTDCSDLNDIQRLTLAWSAKETLYKWLAEAGIDFKKHLVLRHINGVTTHGVIVAEVRHNVIRSLFINYLFLDNMVLTWATT